MERRTNKKIEQYLTKFKDDIKHKLFELNVLDKHLANQFMEYIYDYERLVFVKDDFCKRKRNNNEIPDDIRCIAELNNKEQCTRRKKDNSNYCGTHSKLDVIETSEKQNKNSVNLEQNETHLKDEEDIEFDSEEDIEGGGLPSCQNTKCNKYTAPPNSKQPLEKKIDVLTEDIGGIVYYMDKYNNLYKHEDILNDKKNPEIIGKGFQENGIWKLKI